MKSKEEQPDDVPKSKSAFRFFAGLGIGIFFGWLGTVFRRAPRPVEQAPATLGNTDFKIPIEDGPGCQSLPPDAIVSINSSEADTEANQQQNGAEEGVPPPPGSTPEYTASP